MHYATRPKNTDVALVYCLFPFSFCGCIFFSQHVIVITNFKALLKCRAKFRFVTPGTLKLLSNSQTYGHMTGHAIRISLWRLWTDVMSRTRKPMRPARTDKMTRRTHKRSRLVKTMSWTGNSTSRTRKTTTRLEVSGCGKGETAKRNDESNLLSTIYLLSKTCIKFTSYTNERNSNSSDAVASHLYF